MSIKCHFGSSFINCLFIHVFATHYYFICWTWAVKTAYIQNLKGGYIHLCVSMWIFAGGRRSGQNQFIFIWMPFQYHWNNLSTFIKLGFWMEWNRIKLRITCWHALFLGECVYERVSVNEGSKNPIQWNMDKCINWWLRHVDWQLIRRLFLGYFLKWMFDSMLLQHCRMWRMNKIQSLA